MGNLKLICYPGQWILQRYYFIIIIIIYFISLYPCYQSIQYPEILGGVGGGRQHETSKSIQSVIKSSPFIQNVNSSISFNEHDDNEKNVQSDSVSHSSYHQTYNSCLFIYDEIETGFISSPNFPGPFPVPIHCTWIIRAPIGNVITLYWTQFYLKEGFSATEYAFYINSTLNAGGSNLLTSYIEGDLIPLVTGKPVLVLEMTITDDRNIYLRNMDWFLNAYGFNITFTIVPFNTLVGNKIIQDYCSVFKCSFNGQCLASRDNKVQYCSCFPGFFGRFCQYGPKCDPQKGINPCKDGTDCRYFAGSHFTKCSTVDAFFGEDHRSRLTHDNITKTGFQILKIEVEDDVTPTEDSKLTLSCLIQSTNSIEVKWYKDFTLIDTETSFLRKMSTSLGRSSIRSTGGHYLASLTIGKLYPLDSGIFTCEAIDLKHRTRVNGSYELRVLSKPQVKVYPLSSTVYSLQTFTVSCFSVDYDPLIGYNWLKNGEILNPLYDSELIEDLYPAGIRLIVPKALTRAVYTCLVTTPLGTVGKESILTVIPSNLTNELRQTCSKETHEDVDWPETAIDGVAVEPCPPGYKDGGVTRRRCFANGKWDEADFSSCLNYQMFYIQEKLMSLTLGYHLVSHSSLMNQLKESLNGLRLKPSQGHFIIHLLESLMAILKLTMDSMETHESSQLALDIISSLLNKPESINSLTGLSNLHRLLMEYSLLSSKIVKGQHNHQITRSNFVVEILNLDHRSNHLLPSTLNSPTIASSSSSSSSASALSSSKHLNNNNKPLSSSSSLSSTATSTLSSSTSIPSWLTDSVQVDITSLPGYNQNKSSSSSSSYSSSYSPKGSTTSHSTDQLKSVLTVFYQNLTSFLPKNVIIHKDFTYEEYQIHSKVVTVALVHRAHYIPTKPYPLRVTAHLRHHPSIEDHVNGKKITCGLVQFNERIGFETQNCQTSTETSDSSSTICICDITGAYSVLVTSQFNKNSDQYNPEVELNPTDQEEYPEQYQYQLHQNQHQTNHVPIDIDNLLIISFLISIGLITLTIIIILIRSRFRLNCLRCLKLQICLATIGIEFSFMATYKPMDIISIPWMNIFQLILFFQLVCNCLQISLCTIVYASVSQYNYGKHDVPYIKITFLGWVIPLSLTGAAVVASDLDDSYRPDKMTDIEGQYFYFTNGSALFITIIHLILVTILKIKFSDRHKKELLDSFRRLDNGTKILNQSLLTIFWTDFFLIANFYYRSSRKIVSKYFISVLSCLLGLNVIICYGFFAQIDENFLLDSGNNLPTAQQQSTKQERESKTTANLPINKQLANNVYALDEMDIASTFNRVTLTEFDVHYEPGRSDL